MNLMFAFYTRFGVIDEPVSYIPILADSPESRLHDKFCHFSLPQYHLYMLSVIRKNESLYGLIIYQTLWVVKIFERGKQRLDSHFRGNDVLILYGRCL